MSKLVGSPDPLYSPLVKGELLSYKNPLVVLVWCLPLYLLTVQFSPTTIHPSREARANRHSVYI